MNAFLDRLESKSKHSTVSREAAAAVGSDDRPGKYSFFSTKLFTVTVSGLVFYGPPCMCSCATTRVRTIVPSYCRIGR